MELQGLIELFVVVLLDTEQVIRTLYKTCIVHKSGWVSKYSTVVLSLAFSSRKMINYFLRGVKGFLSVFFPFGEKKKQ